ncbi:MAG: purine-binding chemotaxis protein CheW [Deltaproteobacteria bacterium]|nr:purine-binding chemotaxis protein CheW [Deltaproteobacteria bacterium]
MAENKDLVTRNFEDEEDEDTQKDKYLTFSLGDEEYGIEIQYVIEVIGLQKITHIPDMPDFVKGVINLRGQVIPVMDVRTRFKMPIKEHDDRTCVIVVNIQDTSIGLVVDEVSEVMDIPAERVEDPPRINQRDSRRLIQGLGKVNDEVKILLDVHKLLYEDELAQLSGSL